MKPRGTSVPRCSLPGSHSAPPLARAARGGGPFGAATGKPGVPDAPGFGALGWKPALGLLGGESGGPYFLLTYTHGHADNPRARVVRCGSDRTSRHHRLPARQSAHMPSMGIFGNDSRVRYGPMRTPNTRGEFCHARHRHKPKYQERWRGVSASVVPLVTRPAPALPHSRIAFINASAGSA